jgi:hypothetical protein
MERGELGFVEMGDGGGWCKCVIVAERGRFGERVEVGREKVETTVANSDGQDRLGLGQFGSRLSTDENMG